MTAEFGGTIGRTYADSEPWWPPLPNAPDGAPNVVIVLLDDVGYAQFGCYGSDIATPCFDRLASTGRRYANFHTTALCSPTRACLLTGRNHHSNGMARVVELAAGFPGLQRDDPEGERLPLRDPRPQRLRHLRGRQVAPHTGRGDDDGQPARSLAARSRVRAVLRLHGRRDRPVPSRSRLRQPPGRAAARTPEEGYHLTEDLADKAILFLKDLRATAPDKPFFLWFTPGACHAPHQAPAEYIERYRGHFDQGWDRWRDDVFARQLESGLLPPGTECSERPAWVPAWDSLSADERRLAARMMEVFAGFLTHTDAQVGARARLHRPSSASSTTRSCSS